MGRKPALGIFDDDAAYATAPRLRTAATVARTVSERFI
jgi:hypothetical protein